MCPSVVHLSVHCKHREGRFQPCCAGSTIAETVCMSQGTSLQRHGACHEGQLLFSGVEPQATPDPWRRRGTGSPLEQWSSAKGGGRRAGDTADTNLSTHHAPGSETLQWC